MDLSQPLFMAPDNFTPLARTPWGGTRLADEYKSHLLPSLKQKIIGEAWEFSCDPDFPSLVYDLGMLLPEMIHRWPEQILGKAYRDTMLASCELLVKLVDAAAPLSLQIHPEDDDPNLAAHECGKPECWYILDVATPDAGLYLGFKRRLSVRDLEAALRDGEKAKELLQFVPVQPGDYFEIAAGVPHAIGAGVTLLEPQRTIFAKTGKTYRMWDWGRRYNDAGQLDMEHGKSRELHIKESLALCRPKEQVGLSYVDSLRRVPQEKHEDGIIHQRFPANSYCQLHIFEAEERDANLTLAADSYLVAIVLGGSVKFSGVGRTALKGQTVLLPSSCLPIDLVVRDGAKLAVLSPANYPLK